MKVSFLKSIPAYKMHFYIEALHQLSVISEVIACWYLVVPPE